MRRAGVAAALTALALAAPGTAQGDGDPASDVLLSQDVFHPYPPNATPAPVERALDGMAARAKAGGYPVEVALIAAPEDLGAYPYLFREPATYAELLAKELSLDSAPRVLVVLPAGIGTRNIGEAASLRGLQVHRGAGGDGLARTAMVAIGRLTAAAGRPVPVPPIAREAPGGDGGGAGGGTSLLLIAGVPLLLVAAGATLAARRSRRRAEPERGRARS